MRRCRYAVKYTDVELEQSSQRCGGCPHTGGVLNLFHGLRPARGEMKRPWTEPWGLQCSQVRGPEDRSTEEAEKEEQRGWRKMRRVLGAKEGFKLEGMTRSAGRDGKLDLVVWKP